MSIYSRCADIVEIIIRDLTGRKMEHLKFNGMDKKTQTKTGTKLYSKYNLDLTPDKTTEIKEEKDWIDENNSFI